MPIEPSKTPKQTVVEEGTELKGTLKSSCPVVVNGVIDGELEAPEITITRSGSVAGSLRASKLRSLGTLSGKVEATDVFLSGVVRSNTAIKAKRLEVKLGSEQAQIEVNFGECALEVGEALPDVVALTPGTRSEVAGALPEATGSESWALPLADSSSGPATPLGSAAPSPPQGNGGATPNRSPWKPSRSIDVGGQDVSKTLR